MNKPHWTLLVTGALILPAALTAQNGAPTPTVLLSGEMQTALERIYGGSEAPVLERTILDRVGAALGGAGCAGAARIEITLRDARPTHPTDEQIKDNPALDRLRTHFAGGAAFSVRLLDPAGAELKSLRYDWYAPDDRHGSRAAEPWGDVRLASEGLGSQLAHECRALARTRPSGS
jgi:hypothetical protein